MNDASGDNHVGGKMNWIWQKNGDDKFSPPDVSGWFDGFDRAKTGLSIKLPVGTEVFAREFVQNYVDASESDYSSSKPKKLSFHFLSFVGPEAKEVRTRLGLESLRGRFSELTDSQKMDMKLDESNAVISEEIEEFRLLVAVESGTCGMYGQFELSESVFDSRGEVISTRMRDALLDTNRDNVASVRGYGSYGQGKNAIIGASRVKTLMTYTAFSPKTNEDNVSARFLGTTYWRNHSVEGLRYSGLAWLGGEERNDGKVSPVPLEDESAHTMVKELNIPNLAPRDSAGEQDYGTSTIIVDPDIEPSDLSVAIKLNWWPLLMEPGHTIEVFDYSGEQIPFENIPEITPFEETLRAMIDSGDKDQDFLTIKDLSQASGKKDAMLGLCVDMTPNIGFSVANPKDGTSIVAQIRNRMMVSYRHYPRSGKDHIPFVRGVCLVDRDLHSDAEERLRSIEPPLHNHWQADPRMDGSKKGLSQWLEAQIKEELTAFQAKFRSEIKKSVAVELLAELLPGEDKGVTPPPPPPKPRSEFSLQNAGTRLIESDGKRVAQASRTLELNPKNCRDDEVEVVVSLGWEVLEDGKWRPWAKAMDPQTNSDDDDASWNDASAPETSQVAFEGILKKGTQYEFSWDSPPYGQTWTLRPSMTVQRRTEAEA